MTDNIYKHLRITGSSQVSSDQAVHNAIKRASETIREMRWFQIVDVRGHIEGGAVAYWQVTVEVGFTLDD